MLRQIMLGIAVAVVAVDAFAPAAGFFRKPAPPRPLVAKIHPTLHLSGTTGTGDNDDGETRWTHTFRAERAQALDRHFTGQERDRELVAIETQWNDAYNTLYHPDTGLLCGQNSYQIKSNLV